MNGVRINCAGCGHSFVWLADSIALVDGTWYCPNCNCTRAESVTIADAAGLAPKDFVSIHQEPALPTIRKSRFSW